MELKNSLPENFLVKLLTEFHATLKGEKGEKGDKGDTPIAGKDFFTKEDIKNFFTQVRPIKGLDYFDGKNGKDADPKKVAIELKSSKMFMKAVEGKDGKSVTPTQVADQLKNDPSFVDKVTGEKGDKPKHEWKKTKLRFENPDGSWGQWVELKGLDGRVMYQSDVPRGAGGVVASTGGTGVSTFLALSDTPSAFAGASLQVVRVNAAETALEFVTLAGGGDALVANPLSQFAVTTSLQLKNTISDETGSGALVFADTPTLVTPVLGVATATSINGATITSGTLNGSVTGTNTGDQTSIVGITGTKAQFDTAVSDGNIVFQGEALGTPASGTLTNATGLPASSVVAGAFVAGMEASDHGIASTDQLVNVCYGTGSPPTASTTTEGTIFIQYVA